MADPETPELAIRNEPEPPRLRLWQLCLLPVLAAIAISNIQDQRRTEPVLIALAAVGFLLYGFLGWFGWRIVRRFRSRIGEVPATALHLVAMSALFLIACACYLVIEHFYLIR